MNHIDFMFGLWIGVSILAALRMVFYNYKTDTHKDNTTPIFYLVLFLGAQILAQTWAILDKLQ